MQPIIHELGLSPKEEVVLIALIELGAAQVTRIAQKANLNRTTCYDILEHLNILGLVGYVADQKKKTFVAEPPETLVSYLERRSKQFAAKAEEVRKALPELKAKYSERGRGPKIRFYEGKEGLKTVYEDTLTTHEPIRAYASVRNMHDALPDYFPEYYKRRTKKNISIRAILPATPEGIERSQHDAEEARESALVDPEQFNFSPEINVYDNKIAIMSLAEEFAVIIESKEIAEAQKKIFELAWKGAKSEEK
ncbi:MAG TPA: helix-turn-helix domain-containing protein [Patescibacteria group bacterium]